MSGARATAGPWGRRLIYWFRQDLRLGDQPALAAAAAQAEVLWPVYVHDPAQRAPGPWGVAPLGHHRARFLADTLNDLAAGLAARGSGLTEADGDPAVVLPALARAWGADAVVTEDILAPEEQAAVAALRAAGLRVHTVWQSGLFEPTDLPFEPARVPTVFTDFRRAVESAATPVRPPRPVPGRLPPAPDRPAPQRPPLADSPGGIDPRSSFPYGQPAWRGGETAALAHVRRYFESDAPRQYKATRNGLSGTGYSTKFSPWLANGSVSARQIHAALLAHERRRGASDGSRWIVFELLWREHFRWLHARFGRRLYHARGLAPQAGPPAHDAAAFARWCAGRTGEPLVDAGLRELAATGYLSNRLRQVVASALIHDAPGDWRAGAAWFEHQLVDYDVHSNHGNWLYIAGRGTDPRGGRRFNPEKQAREHDPDGAFQRLWLG